MSQIRKISTLERIHSHQGSRLILVGVPSSGRDLILKFICSTYQGGTQQHIVVMEGVEDATTTTEKWKNCINELYMRVGVECEYVTLVVKHLERWPTALISQLLALIMSGEIPGAFTLEDQIKLATRVCDDRLMEMEKHYQTQILQIQQDAETRKKLEIHQLKQEDNEAHRIRNAMFYQEVERKHQNMLQVRLSQAQLRYQQEMDDFIRKCEVENESITATIMSLMRPLGMTSGKWQQIIQRMRQRLHIVISVDDSVNPKLMKQVPQLYHQCSVVPFDVMDKTSLQAIVFGSFYTQVKQLVDIKSGEVKDLNDIEFEDQLEHELPKITELAVEMYLIAVKLSNQNGHPIPTQFCSIVSLYFGRLLEEYIRRDREERKKAESAMYAYNSIEKSLQRLRDQDSELQTRLKNCEEQLEISQELLLEQQEDCDRIRDMMRRFQVTAEEQVQVTSDMEMQAQSELHVPMACLEEANAALLLIDKRHIIEIKSFNSPPQLVHLVLDAICVMFAVEPTWENARKILGDANIVNNMLSYDKDNISNDILNKLEMKHMSDPKFIREEVEKQSVAASMMVVWVRAMFQYASARRQVKPTLDKLGQAQSRLRLLMQEYQVSKQRVIEADEALGRTKTTLEESKKLKRQTVEEIESRQIRLQTGEIMLNCLQEDKTIVVKQIEDLDMEKECGVVWWNALLSAAFLVYNRLFNAQECIQLFNEWGEAYQRVNCEDTQTSICLEPVLHININHIVEDREPKLQDTEQDSMKLFLNQNHRFRFWAVSAASGVFFSQRDQQDSFYLMEIVAAAFPVTLITQYTKEMEEKLMKLARYVWKWSHFTMISVHAENFQTNFISALKHGHQLLVLDVEPLDIEYPHGKLGSIFSWETMEVDGQTHLVMKSNGTEACQTVPIHPEFRSFMLTHKSAKNFSSTITIKVPLLNAQIHASEIENVILDKLWFSVISSECQQTFGLKRVIREYERMQLQHDDQMIQLIKLIKNAARRGDFQCELIEKIQVVCKTAKTQRVALRDKYHAINEEANLVITQQSNARLAASLYNGFNNRETLQTQPTIISGTRIQPLSLDMYITMVFAALKRPDQASRQPDKNLNTFMSHQSGIGNRNSIVPVHHSSTHLASVATGVFESTNEILRKLLLTLMPYCHNTDDWYDFLMQALLSMNQNQELSGKLFQSVESSVEVNHVSNSTPFHQLQSVYSILVGAKLRLLQLCPTTIDSLLQLTEDQSLHLALDGQIIDLPQDIGIDHQHLTTMSSKSREDRIKIGLCFLPHMLPTFCDHLLQHYQVKTLYRRESDRADITQNVIRTPKTLNQKDTSMIFKFGERGKNQQWLHILATLSKPVCVVIQSNQAFGSFAFLKQVFSQIFLSRGIRLAVMKAAYNRSFNTTSDLSDVFLVPKFHFEENLDNSPDQVLMIRDIHKFLLSRNNLSMILEDAPVALLHINQSITATQEAIYWEELFHFLHQEHQNTSSVAIRRYESLIPNAKIRVETQGNDLKPSTTSPINSTSKRIVTRHGTSHKLSASDVTLNKSRGVPRIMTIVSSLSNIPLHLRQSILWLPLKSSEECCEISHPSLKTCIQDVLIRLSFHPCRDMVLQILSSEESFKTTKGSDGLELPVIKLLWSYWTALVLFHAILIYRRRLSLIQMTHNSPCGDYGFDVLITATDQLLHLLLQLKSDRLALTSQLSLIKLVNQQVFFAAYSRQAKSRHESIVIHRFGHECLCLMEDSIQQKRHSNLEGTEINPNIVVDMLTSTYMSQKRRPSVQLLSLNTSPGRQGSLTNLTKRRSSGYNQAATFLAGFMFPLDQLRSSIQDFESWLGLTWDYAESVTTAMENNVRDEFALHPDFDVPTYRLKSTSSVPMWVNMLGWRNDFIEDRDSAYVKLKLVDVIECLNMLRMKTLPSELSTNLGEVFTPERELDEQQGNLTSLEPCSNERNATKTSRFIAASSLELLSWNSTVECYNHHIQNLQQKFDELLTILRFWQNREGSAATLASVKNSTIQEDVLTVLSNSIPPSIGDQIATSPTYGLMTKNKTLHELVMYYQHWHRYLSQCKAIVWWLPGIPTVMSFDHVAERSKRAFELRNHRQLDRYELFYKLEIENWDETSLEWNLETKDTASNVIVIFRGLQLCSATWNLDQGYLQLFETGADSSLQRVSVLYQMQERNNMTTSGGSAVTESSSSGSIKLHSSQHTTRSCPVMLHDRVLFEIDLPVCSSLSTLISPYLVLSLE